MEKKSIVYQKAIAFALEIIELYKVLRTNKEFVLSKQLLRSGTSIGANISEALAGQSRKDFIAKMSISSKEARETSYWLMLLQKSQLVIYDYKKEMESCNELIRLLTSIVKTTQSK
ncbi:four helix bundle protein [Fulvivirgaceae bacterium BMA10]|uniref:Four helix bundle protein n=1 Tax=Splendidivirga corallicola TaxID=3051826 RepID=A0ABT8KWU2_9BACT|nr:four helix bundle protein [Fulvivirgaceae bacterium BMA10]